MTNDDTAFLDKAQSVNLALLKESFDQATNYANLFIVAGYGSFFALLSITSDRLADQREAVIAAALSMLISVTMFISFQVYTLYRHNSALLRFVDALMNTPAKSVDEYAQRYEQYGFESKQRSIGYSRWWFWTFLATVVTAAIADCILGCAFARVLLAS